MNVNNPIELSSMVLIFAVMGVIAIGALLVVMRLRHRYDPNLIGALIGALLCFMLIEALPAII
ncbi:hypothetical protein AB4851_19965 [Burkholderia sp. 22PA0099]|uniref:hypothetical protein n=1 Tax=Burkholderia sp. 22PA0099 TaxID=3237372 RepID=UPI0039C38BCB